MFRRRNRHTDGTCSPGVQQAHEERAYFEQLSAQIDADAPRRAEQREEAKVLRRRGEYSSSKNHFGETIELAMRNKRAAH